MLTYRHVLSENLCQLSSLGGSFMVVNGLIFYFVEVNYRILLSS
jgi:hypothetical protein